MLAQGGGLGSAASRPGRSPRSAATMRTATHKRLRTCLRRGCIKLDTTSGPCLTLRLSPSRHPRPGKCS